MTIMKIMKMEIMSAMVKELGNFANQIYESRQSVYVIHQVIKAIHVFHTTTRAHEKVLFYTNFFFSEMRVN